MLLNILKHVLPFWSDLQQTASTDLVSRYFHAETHSRAGVRQPILAGRNPLRVNLHVPAQHVNVSSLRTAIEREHGAPRRLKPRVCSSVVNLKLRDLACTFPGEGLDRNKGSYKLSYANLHLPGHYARQPNHLFPSLL